MPQGVCVLGDTAVDLIVHLPEFHNGEKTMTHQPSFHPGGSGANTAVALARLGIQTQFIGTVGKDQFGQAVVDDLNRENVEIDQLFVNPALSTVCVFAFVDQEGERYLWGWPRENQSFVSIEFEKIDLEQIRKAGWLHTTGLLLANESSGRYTTLDVLEWAHTNEVATSLDLNLRINAGSLEKTYHEVVNRAVASAKYVLGSEYEFSLLDESHNWEKAVAGLAHQQKIIIVRRGEEGSLLFADGECIESSAFQVKVADTIGAGDVFNAGFIAALLNKQDYATALQWGNAIAGYTIAREGARTSPTLEQLRDFIDK